MLSPEDAVNTYLIEHYNVCLEEVIADATEGKVRASLAAVVETTATRLDHWGNEDGAVAELFTGTVTLNGARYSWRASIYTDLDGGRFVADLGDFKPMDWRRRCGW